MAGGGLAVEVAGGASEVAGVGEIVDTGLAGVAGGGLAAESVGGTAAAAGVMGDGTLAEAGVAGVVAADIPLGAELCEEGVVPAAAPAKAPLFALPFPEACTYDAILSFFFKDCYSGPSLGRKVLLCTQWKELD